MELVELGLEALRSAHSNASRATRAMKNSSCTLRLAATLAVVGALIAPEVSCFRVPPGRLTTSKFEALKRRHGNLVNARRLTVTPNGDTAPANDDAGGARLLQTEAIAPLCEGGDWLTIQGDSLDAPLNAKIEPGAGFGLSAASLSSGPFTVSLDLALARKALPDGNTFSPSNVTSVCLQCSWGPFGADSTPASTCVELGKGLKRSETVRSAGSGKCSESYTATFPVNALQECLGERATLAGDALCDAKGALKGTTSQGLSKAHVRVAATVTTQDKALSSTNTLVEDTELVVKACAEQPSFTQTQAKRGKGSKKAKAKKVF
jgi:hypothetical protein